MYFSENGLTMHVQKYYAQDHRVKYQYVVHHHHDAMIINNYNNMYTRVRRNYIIPRTYFDVQITNSENISVPTLN